jgi:hypothetical protein
MLLTSEIQRIKIELGFNALTLSALPYAFDGVTQIFEQVVQQYLQGGALTYSSTAVTAATTPTIVSLTVTSATGISVGDRVVVDQDLAQEYSHVSVIAGSTISVALTNAHAGTYPVTVEGGESIVRRYLRECIAIQDKISKVSGRVGVKRVNEIEFFAQTGDQAGVRAELLDLQRYWRNELAAAIGVPNLREEARGAGQLLESY